jgi:hypothetical protein
MYEITILNAITLIVLNNETIIHMKTESNHEI